MIYQLLIFLVLLQTITATAAESFTGLQPYQMGVLINQDDPESVTVGTYYAERRKIPERNLIRISLPANKQNLTVAEFKLLQSQLQGLNHSGLQALAVAWLEPFRVDCMSLTSALAFGFDRRYCAKGCKTTRSSPYFNSTTDSPRKILDIQPAMMLAGSSTEEVKALIDRGVASDNTQPDGTAYLLRTKDRNRSVRAMFYPEIRSRLGNRFKIRILPVQRIINKQDVMFYFTGLKEVPDIGTNGFLPGAIADHLTSFGGRLTGSNRQMSSLEWLRAGATASYGTVVEPCNFPGKFPHPGVLMQHYLNGDTAIEAYWKSVSMPGQGVFIGEPLARPFARPAPFEQGDGTFDIDLLLN